MYTITSHLLQASAWPSLLLSGCTSANTLQFACSGQPTIRSLPHSADRGESCQVRTAAFAFTDQSQVGLFLLTMAWHHHRRKSLHA